MAAVLSRGCRWTSGWNGGGGRPVESWPALLHAFRAGGPEQRCHEPRRRRPSQAIHEPPPGPTAELELPRRWGCPCSFASPPLATAGFVRWAGVEQLVVIRTAVSTRGVFSPLLLTPPNLTLVSLT